MFVLTGKRVEANKTVHSSLVKYSIEHLLWIKVILNINAYSY